ncbi:MAG: hypothetical protein M5R36_27045 [Deltaproteobacteria bacterium]|nr:hypothetical protein [Deltaproteobacteria bacterium]
MGEVAFPDIDDSLDAGQLGDLQHFAVDSRGEALLAVDEAFEFASLAEGNRLFESAGHQIAQGAVGTEELFAVFSDGDEQPAPWRTHWESATTTRSSLGLRAE